MSRHYKVRSPESQTTRRSRAAATHVVGAAAPKLAARRAVKYHGSEMRARARPSPRRVGSLLTAAVPALEERLRERRIHAQWGDAVGPEIARRARPGRLDRGVLEVRVDNSPWLAELSLRQQELLAALHGHFPGVVRGLRVGLGPPSIEAPAVAERVTAPAEAAPPTLSAEDLAEIDAVVGVVSDPEIARALRHLMQTDRRARTRGVDRAKGAR